MHVWVESLCRKMGEQTPTDPVSKMLETHSSPKILQTPQRCRKCGKLGREEEHHLHCDECNCSPDNTAACTHVQCANCHAHYHCADNPICPKLAHFPKPPNNATLSNSTRITDEIEGLSSSLLLYIPHQKSLPVSL